MEATAREFEAAHRHKVLPVACDVADEASVEEAAGLVIAAFGRVDILVNNAGIAPLTPMLDLELADLRRVLDVNVVGSFLFARAFGAHMVAQRKGCIINIASMAGPGGQANLPTRWSSEVG